MRVGDRHVSTPKFGRRPIEVARSPPVLPPQCPTPERDADWPLTRRAATRTWCSVPPVLDWFLRLMVLAVVAAIVVAWFRAQEPESDVDDQARQRIREVEDEVRRLGRAVADMRHRIEVLERRSRWSADPPPDP
jgi:hypothetical protein